MQAMGFMDSDSDSEPQNQAAADNDDKLFLNEVLSGLSLWMDRVFDGSVRKIRLNEWPEMAPWHCRMVSRLPNVFHESIVKSWHFKHIFNFKHRFFGKPLPTLKKKSSQGKAVNTGEAVFLAASVERLNSWWVF